MGDPRPVFARFTTGEPFDFGTHANDFLLGREHAHATETFLVRVPGLGEVPEHLHTDMEQTFVFLSGVGEAALRRDGEEPVRHTCFPGDMLFVPTGWRHTVAASTIEGVSYLTVNAFLPAAERVGDSAVAHATIAHAGFQDQGPVKQQPQPATEPPDALAVFRTAEAMFLPDTSSRRAWPQDFTAPRATLDREPDRYRLRRIGPFEYVKTVTPAPRVLTEELADALFHATGRRLPVYVEGSQSPLSVKQPCSESDLDILLAIDSADQLELVDGTLDDLRDAADHTPVPLSFGVVHHDWLRLPSFYSALSLDPTSPDRRWWRATAPERVAEAARRTQEGLAQFDDLTGLRDLLARSLAVTGHGDDNIDEWRVIPRWQGYR